MVYVAAASPRYALAGEDCVGAGRSVATRSPSSFGYALLANPRTLVPRCVIGYWDIAALLENYNPVAKTGTGWSDVHQIGGIYTASFTSAGGENCKAFFKLGPPWQGGFLWRLSGWLCGVPGNSVQDRDLQSFVDALIVKAQ